MVCAKFQVILRRYISFIVISDVVISANFHIKSFVPDQDFEIYVAKTDRSHYKGYPRYHLSQYPYASWVYDHNEVSYFVHLITEGLAKFYPKDHLPQDSVSLSYWFVQNYQLTHEERLDILQCSSVLKRLRLELEYLNTKRTLICGKCSIDIADQNDVFAMSREGVQSNYCNPGGQVYETITVSEIKNFSTVGEPSKQFTWFPGYAWTIIQCKCCTSHLGWLFTSHNHQPSRFFGLALSCLDIKKH